MTAYDDLPERLRYVYSRGDWEKFSAKDKAYLERDLSPTLDSIREEENRKMRWHWSELEKVRAVRLDDETKNKILNALNEAERVPSWRVERTDCVCLSPMPINNVGNAVRVLSELQDMIDKFVSE